MSRLEEPYFQWCKNLFSENELNEVQKPDKEVKNYN